MAKLKRKVTILDDVEEVYRPLYTKVKDGFEMAEIEGLVPTEKVTEFRETNITLKKELEKFEGIDPEKYNELLGIETKLKENKLLDTGKVDEIVDGRTKKMKEEHQKEITIRDTTISAQKSQLSMLLIDSAVKSSAVTAGALPTAIDDVVLRAKAVFTINKDGHTVALGPNGQVQYGKNGTDPLSIDEWVGDLKRGPGMHLFQGMKGSGASGGGGKPGEDLSKLTAAQKISRGMAENAGA